MNTNKYIITSLAIALFAISLGGTAMNASLTAQTTSGPRNLWSEKVLCGILGFCGSSSSAVMEQQSTGQYPAAPLPPGLMSTGRCGDGICQSIVCMALGCPEPETAENCPQDCDPNHEPGFIDPSFPDPYVPSWPITNPDPPATIYDPDLSNDRQDTLSKQCPDTYQCSLDNPSLQCPTGTHAEVGTPIFHCGTNANGGRCFQCIGETGGGSPAPSGGCPAQYPFCAGSTAAATAMCGNATVQPWPGANTHLCQTSTGSEGRCFACGQTGTTPPSNLPPCQENECGPHLGLPSHLCPDGVTWAGPGPCARGNDGQCHWQIISCPNTGGTPGEICGDNICTALEQMILCVDPPATGPVPGVRYGCFPVCERDCAQQNTGICGDNICQSNEGAEGCDPYGPNGEGCQNYRYCPQDCSDDGGGGDTDMRCLNSSRQEDTDFTCIFRDDIPRTLCDGTAYPDFDMGSHSCKEDGILGYCFLCRVP